LTTAPGDQRSCYATGMFTLHCCNIHVVLYTSNMAAEKSYAEVIRMRCISTGEIPRTSVGRQLRHTAKAHSSPQDGDFAT